jgi:hypothetical protein
MVIDQGHRVVYENEAIVMEDSLKDFNDEYRMRVRVTLRAFWALWDMRQLLGVRFPLFSWQLWSHKVLRYLSFIFLITAFYSNLMLFGASALYTLLLIGQIGFYLLSMVTMKEGANVQVKKFANLCRYFSLINIACGHAFVKFLLGEKMVTWTPRKGA